MTSVSTRLIRHFQHRLVNHTRPFSSTPTHFEKITNDELLSDARLQEIVAQLEKPLSKPVATDSLRILLESINAFKPTQNILSSKKFEKLDNFLDKSFNVRQLAAYLKAQGISLPSQRPRKQQLINTIIGQHWGVKSHEQVRQEAIRRIQDTTKQIFPASKQELFFIIADNGNTIRRIEKAHEVNITIDVSKNRYVVTGTAKSVEMAKEAIFEKLKIIRDVVKMPQVLKENGLLEKEIQQGLTDISKVSGTFVSLIDGKFYLSSLTENSMDNAKRLISLMLTEISARKETSTTIVHNNAEYTTLPFHDSSAMSLYDRNLTWNKLVTDRRSGDYFEVLGGEKVGSLDNLKQILYKPFGGLIDVSTEAKFGQLLFQNNNSTVNYSKTYNNTSDLLSLFKNRSIFFKTMPPRELTAPFTPLTLDGGFQQRTVLVEYINKSLLIDSHEQYNDGLNKLKLEFVVQNNGDIKLHDAIGEKSRSIIDILGAYGNTDIRLVAKNFVSFNNSNQLEELIGQCKLLGYSELMAPIQHENMILRKVSFINKKRYLVDSNLISVNQVEQEQQRKRAELSISVVNPDTLGISNSFSRWSSFTNILSTIAHKWDYHSTTNKD